jgi:hypothetical protein
MTQVDQPPLLYRLGRAPNPAVLPPREYIGGGRFDDPLGEFRTLYAAEQREACFAESLAPLRPSLAALATYRKTARPPSGLPLASISTDWRLRRRVVRLGVAPGQRWLDLRRLAVREQLRADLAEDAISLGIDDIDVSFVRGPVREFTQLIARSTRERGFVGVTYASRFDDSFSCWAIFEGASYEQIGEAEPITADDPDLMAVASFFGLRVS